MPARVLALGLAAAAAGLATACDSSGDAVTTPTATAAAAGPSAVDPCIVGSWKSTAITGTLVIGTSRVSIRGGAGELLSIDAAGAITTDDSNTAPVGGTAADGTDYRLTQTGTAKGTIVSAAGRIEVTLDQPTTLTVTLYKNGNSVRQQHPGSANDTYTCKPHSSLVITGGGGTVSTYTPA